MKLDANTIVRALAIGVCIFLAQLGVEYIGFENTVVVILIMIWWAIPLDKTIS